MGGVQIVESKHLGGSIVESNHLGTDKRYKHKPQPSGPDHLALVWSRAGLEPNLVRNQTASILEVFRNKVFLKNIRIFFFPYANPFQVC